MDETITAEYLRECFEHRADGNLVWRVRPAHHFTTAGYAAAFNARHGGNVAGRPNAEGYLVVSLQWRGRGRKLLVARLIWAMHTGTWPAQQIDHINRVRDDNRIANLRDVSLAENQDNKPHSNLLPGAYASSGHRFRSQISIGGRVTYLGSFDTPQQANAAFVRACAEMRAA